MGPVATAHLTISARCPDQRTPPSLGNRGSSQSLMFHPVSSAAVGHGKEQTGKTGLVQCTARIGACPPSGTRFT